MWEWAGGIDNVASWFGGKESSPETRKRKKQWLVSFPAVEEQHKELQTWIREGYYGMGSWLDSLSSPFPNDTAWKAILKADSNPTLLHELFTRKSPYKDPLSSVDGPNCYAGYGMSPYPSSYFSNMCYSLVLRMK